MSSAAYLTFESGVTTEQWRGFCAEHDVVHSPNTVGGNVYYLHGNPGGVEVAFKPQRIVFSTFFHGAAMPDVARLAVKAWAQFGGSLTADPEIRAILTHPTPATTGEP